MTLSILTISVIAGLMLAENQVSRRHERLLRARGAVMPPGDVFAWLRIVYPAAFIVMGVESFWRAAVVGTSVSAYPGPSWFASGVLMFAAAKALKFWAIGTLGERWSFHVYFLPNAPPVNAGPYRYVAHPNYIAVVGEVVGTAMMVGAPITGPASLVAVGIVLLARIRFENRVITAMAESARAAPRG